MQDLDDEVDSAGFDIPGLRDDDEVCRDRSEFLGWRGVFAGIPGWLPGHTRVN